MVIAKEGIQNLLGLVRRRYPGWAGFSDERFVNDEANYKRATAAKAREQLSEAELMRLIDVGRFDEMVERLERIGRDNNLLFQAVPLEGDLNVLYQEGLDKESFCRAVLELLYGEGPTPERLDHYAEYVSSRGFPNKWTFPTYLLFFCHPDEETLVKPEAMRWLLKFVGASEKLTKKPKGESYAGVKAVVEALRKALAEFDPGDMIDVQSFIWVAASEARKDKKGIISEEKREEFSRLFEEFAEVYPATPVGQKHAALYKEGREKGRRNFEEVKAARSRGDDITDLVLLKLLPHTDSKNNRAKGAWVYIAPTIQGDLKKWFEKKQWARPEDWPNIANAIYELISRCVERPKELASACAEFDNLPFTKGMQTGFLTPILNAIRPEEFLLINNKSRKAINYFVGKRYPQTIRDYAEVNAAGWQLIDAVKDEIRAAELPNLSEADAFDMFDHWLWAEKKYWDTKKEGVRYWKIAPGEDARNWEACRDGGYIAIGWDELGDLSKVNRRLFTKLMDEQMDLHDDWKKAGLEQVWKFAHDVSEGDRIVANHGTSKVLGIGTVKGDYYFVHNQRYGHRIPVRWDDLAERKVSEGGWRRTLVELDRGKFEVIEKLTPRPDTEPNGPVKDAAFSDDTFRLLAGLHENPTRDFYNARKEEFKKHLEEPFRRLFDSVAGRLAPPVTDFMETEKNILARILKNDWGRGGAWDFFWGAFYPKGGKRTEDAQLIVSINRDRLEYGFYIGEYGNEQRDRFIRNCAQNREALVNLLRQELSREKLLFFGEHEEFVGGPEDPGFPHGEVDWKAWLADPGGIGIHASVFVGKADVLATPLDKLSGKIADAFNKLFPLVLLAAHEAPMPAIQGYIEGDGVEPPVNPEYPLDKCAAETCFEQAMLERWVRAIKRKKQAVIYGPPGTSKTYVAEHLARHIVGGDDGFVEIVQFHPAYAYEDFIQGLRPRAKSDGGLDYPVVPGRFLRFCEEASRRDGVCVLIIDEINRANLARVFGELMYLLEYRDKEVPLAAGGRFRIPDNVRVIGTMNTADRSIALVDHALRRRFAFLELYPDYEVLRKYHEKNGTGFVVEGLINTLKQLNNAIGDRHYHVGITYFLRSDLGEHIEDIWRMEVSPYLEEFFFDESDKAARFNWKNVKEKVSPA